jgi:hypothetical protein
LITCKRGGAGAAKEAREPPGPPSSFRSSDASRDARQEAAGTGRHTGTQAHRYMHTGTCTQVQYIHAHRHHRLNASMRLAAGGFL